MVLLLLVVVSVRYRFVLGSCPRPPPLMFTALFVSHAARHQEGLGAFSALLIFQRHGNSATLTHPLFVDFDGY